MASTYLIPTVPEASRSIPRVLCSGSRTATQPWRAQLATDALVFARQLVTGERNPAQPLVLDHGGADGADALFAEAAAALPGWAVAEHPARWSSHITAVEAQNDPTGFLSGWVCPQWHLEHRTCRMAGHRRNSEMIALAPSLLVAMPTEPRSAEKGSRGTWGAVAAAVKADIPTVIAWQPDEGTAPRLFWANERARDLVVAQIAGTCAVSDRSHPLAATSVDLRLALNEPPF